MVSLDGEELVMSPRHLLHQLAPHVEIWNKYDCFPGIMGEVFATVGFSDFQPWNGDAAWKEFELALEYIQNSWLPKVHHNLVFASEKKGAGKSMLMAVIRRELGEVPSVWINEHELIKRIFKWDGDAYEYIDAIRDVPVLFYDDFGVTAGMSRNETAQGMLYYLIHYRWEHQLPMVVSSNLLIKEMAEDYSRLARRLIEPPFGTDYVCYWPFRFAESYSNRFIKVGKSP